MPSVKSKVSVLTITYNHEMHIEQAVTSAINQNTNFNYEIVVSDDCSTDGTRDILTNLHSRYPNTLRLILRQENIGARQNLIETFKLCEGDYIARLDGDDYWTSEHKLSKQVKLLEANPNFALSFHAASSINELDSKSTQIIRPYPTRDRYTLADLLIHNFIPNCSVMYRNDLFKEFPDWFNKAPMGDWPLHILVAQYGDIGYIDLPMAVYRIHSGGVWTSTDPVMKIRNHISLLRTVDLYLGSQHHAIIKESIAVRELKISLAYVRKGNYWDASVHLLRTILRRRVSLGSLISAVVNRILCCPSLDL